MVSGTRTKGGLGWGEEGAAGGAVGAGDEKGEAGEVVGAGGDLGEVEAFDDPDFGAEHDLMGFDNVFAVAADAEVVDADGADAVVDEVAGGVLADGDEVGVEVVEGPTVG